MRVRSSVSTETWAVDDLVAEARLVRGAARPFERDAVEFCGALSSSLLADAGQGLGPQLVPLGYWLRPASIGRLQDRMARLQDDRTVLVPRGIALHIAPSNVDTMFVYSWVLALLTGCTNVVRISERAGPATDFLLSRIGDLLSESRFDGIRRRSFLVRYGHDDRISASLSAAADVRIVWGGDATVEHFRRFPLPPRSREIAFPNRHSLTVLDTKEVLLAEDSLIDTLGDRFFNDAYWFDQGGCSSPRLVIWRGRRSVAEARERLRRSVDAALLRRGYTAPTGSAIEKLVFGLKAAASVDGAHIAASSNEAMWVELPDLTTYDRNSCGGGIFFDVATDDLERMLVDFADVRDQTIGSYGLSDVEARALATSLNGRGVDRIVRLGRALEFDAVWDGFDMIAELVRRVVVDV